MRMDQKKIYITKEIFHKEGGSLRRGGGGGIAPWHTWWVRLDGNSYPRTGSSLPWIVRPSSPMSLAPTWSSLTPDQTAAPLKPSSWTHSLQIHCNGSARLRSHPSMGPVWKPRPYSILLEFILPKYILLEFKIYL